MSNIIDCNSFVPLESISFQKYYLLEKSYFWNKITFVLERQCIEIHFVKVFSYIINSSVNWRQSCQQWCESFGSVFVSSCTMFLIEFSQNELDRGKYLFYV